MKRFANGFVFKVSARNFLHHFSAGLSGPLLLVRPLPATRALQPGETVRHAWDAVGRHMSRGLRQAATEARSDHLASRPSR